MFIMARSILHMGPDDLSNGKGHFHFFKMAFTSLSKTTSQLEHIPNGKYVLRNPFWPLESSFLMRKSEKKGPNFLGWHGPILRLTFSKLF